MFRSGHKQIRSVGQLLWVVLALSFARFTFAQSGPSNLNVSGVLYSSTGDVINNPSVNFKLEVWDKAATCILYSEEHLGENLSTSKGNFSLALGKGSSINNYLESSSVMTAKVFENSGAVAGGWTGCASGTTLSSGDERLIRLYYDLGGGYVAMNPDVPLASSAYAMVAQTLQGKAASDFVQLRDDASYDLNQANVENVFSSTNYARLLQLLNPSAALGFGSQRLTNLADPTSAQDASTKNYTDSNLAGKNIDLSDVGSGTGGGKVLMWDQSQNKWVASAPSFGGPAGGDLSGTYPNPTVAALAIGTSKLADSAVTSAKINATGITTNRILITDGITGSTVTYKACANDEVLKFVTGTGWACATVASLAPVTSVNGKTGVVTLNAADLSLGTAALKDYGTAAGNLVELDAGAKIPTALLPNLAGDVTGAPSTNVVTAIQGRAVASTAPNDNEVLKWNQAQTRWEPAAISSYAITALTGDVTASGTGSVTATIGNGKVTTAKLFTNPGVNRLVATDSSTGATLSAFSCSLNQIMQWGASGWTCQDVSSVMAGAGDFKADGSVPMTGNLRLNGNFLSGDGGSEGVFVDSSGKVAIGTTSPANNRLLTIDGAAAETGLHVSTTASTHDSVNISTSWLWSDSTAARMYLIGSGTDTSGTSLQDTFRLQAYNGSAWSNPIMIRKSGDIQFNGNGSGSTYSMIVKSTGNVGIGITSPARLLHVAGPMRIAPTTLPSSPAAGDLAFDSGAANALKFYDGSSWQTVGTGTGSGDFKADGSVPMTGNLRLNGNFLSGDGGNEGLYVDSSGNVGLATTSPTTKFSLNSSLLPTSTYSTALPQQLQINDQPTNTANVIAPSSVILSQPSLSGDSSATFVGLIADVYPATDANNYNSLWGIVGNTASRGSGTTTSSMGLIGNASNNGSGTVTNMWGSYNQSVNAGSGSVTNAYGIQGKVQNDSATGSITNAYGALAWVKKTSSGAITNGYGFYTGAIQATNKWSFYASDATTPNYFAGNVGIGTTAPSYKLDVAGSIRSSSGGIVFPDGTTQTTAAGGGGSGQWGYSNPNIYYTAGNVGIGTTNPTVLLDITSAAPSFRLSNTAGGSTSFSQSTGQLNISATSATSSVIDFNPLTSDGSSSAQARFFRTTNTTGAKRVLFYRGDDSTTIDAAIAVGVTDPTYFAANGGSVGIGTKTPYDKLTVSGGEMMVASVTSANGVSHNGVKLTTDNPTYYSAIRAYRDTSSTRIGMSLFTANNASPTEVMRIMPSGEVGIGTTSPTTNLHIQGNGAGNQGIVVSDSGTPKLELRSSSATGDPYIDFTFNSTSNVGAGTPDFSYRIQADGTTGSLFIGPTYKGNQDLVITSTGNVGMGTVSPSYKLDVAGTIRSSTGGIMFPDGTTQTTAAGGGGTGQWGYSNPNVYYTAGNVGIGTTSPAVQLDMLSTSNNAIRVKSSGGDAGVEMDAGSTTDYPFLRFTRGGVGAFEMGKDSSAGSNGFYFNNNTATGSAGAAMYIGSSGNVGIGTINPAGRLQVYGDFMGGNITSFTGLSGSPMYINNAIGYVNTSPVLGLVNWQGTGNYGNTLTFFQSGGAAEGDFTAIPSDRKLGAVEAFGSNGTGAAIAASIGMQADGAPSGAVVPGRINFNITDSAGSSLQAVTIRSTGNVGVGTASPTSPFHVYKNSTATSGTTFASRTQYEIAPSATSTADNRANFVSAYFYGSNSSNAVSGTSVEAYNDSTATLSYMTGLNLYTAHLNSGTTTSMMAINGSVDNSSTAGTITTATAGYFSVLKSGSGSIGTGYGIYIGSVAGTGKWSIYASDSAAPTYLAGNLGVGVPSPTNKLEVAGTTKLGTSGVAFTSMGGCTITSFTAASGANAKTCTGLPAGAAVYCSPSASQGSTVTWGAWASAADTVTLNMSAGGAAASWKCMWMVP